MANNIGCVFCFPYRNDFRYNDLSFLIVCVLINIKAIGMSNDVGKLSRTDGFKDLSPPTPHHYGGHDHLTCLYTSP